MAVIRPKLHPGDRLIAISPAGPVDEQDTRKGADVLRKRGYHVDITPGALRRNDYLAGTDLQRVNDLQMALTSDDYDGILCTRGGYGSMRLLPYLDFDAIERTIKTHVFVGFSDTSALQWALWDRCGIITYSGMLLSRGFGSDDKGFGFGGLDEFTGNCWFDMLEGRLWGKTIPLPEEHEGLKVYRDGPNAIGPLLGGNLAVLAALCGTPFAPKFAGSVVILEEIDEPPYRIDRMLMQLVQSGAFKGVRGFLLGKFTQHLQGEREDQFETAARVLADAVPDVPIVTGAPYGHVMPSWTLPIGADVVLDVSNRTLILEDAN